MISNLIKFIHTPRLFKPYQLNLNFVCKPLTLGAAPNYIPAKVAVMVTLALAVTMTFALRYLYILDNKKRNLAAEISGTSHVQDIEFMDLTDKQNPEFRVSFVHFKSQFRECTLT